jgi:hypothetical protein
MTAATIDFATDAPVDGDLDVRWIHGSPRRTPDSDPAFQVHRYDTHTYVLRQSKALSAEAPFLYLLFGNEWAVLLDTGRARRRLAASLEPRGRGRTGSRRDPASRVFPRLNARKRSVTG